MADPRHRDAAHTRELILDTAREHFAARGLDRATVRAIAADAGVSPNLITRYFGGKRGLFTAATDLDLHLAEILPGPLVDLSERIAAHVVGRWEDHPGDDPMLILLRAAMSDPVAARDLADFLRREAVVLLAEHLATSDADSRAAAVSALIMGTIVQRYVFVAGPLASADRDAVEEWLARSLGGLLTGPAFPPL